MIRIQTEPFDPGVEIERARSLNRGAGAVACFVGMVRDHNEGALVTGLTLEHYPGMTEKAIAEIVDEAKGRWDILESIVIHRIGPLRPTDSIVLVIVASAHRRDAFDACAFIMDYLKTRAPFWKKERTASGDRWVEARASDELATERWTTPSNVAPSQKIES